MLTKCILSYSVLLTRCVADTMHVAADKMHGAADKMRSAANTMCGAANTMRGAAKINACEVWWVAQNQSLTPPYGKKKVSFK